MSGYIRKSIPRTMGRLLKYIEEEPELSKDLPPDPHELREVYELFVTQLQNNVEDIDEVVSVLEQKRDKWLQMASSVPEDKRQGEEEAWASMQEDDNGLEAVIERGRAAARVRRGLLREIEKKIKSLGSLRTAPAAPAMRAQLPRLKLSEFDGNLKMWPMFWNCFDATVNSQPISDIEKLTYLLSLLRGKAKSAVEGFALRPENYGVVISVLRDKFGQNDQLKASLFRELFAVPPVSKNTDFCYVVDKIECILRQLESLGESVNIPSFESVLEDKFPPWVLDQIYAAKEKSTSWSMMDLRTLLIVLSARRQKISNALSERKLVKSDENFSSSSKGSFKGKSKSNFVSKSQVSSTLVSTTLEAVDSQRASVEHEKRETKSRSKAKCYFCSAQHSSRYCKKYPSFEERKKRVSELKLCFKCLRSGHGIAKCRSSSIECFVCKGPHLAVMCPRQETVQSKEQREAISVSREDLTEHEVQSGEEMALVSTVSADECQLVKEEVLLMCRKATISNVELPEKNETVLVFFDPGSQKSYIDENLAEKLGLKSTSESSIKIGSFASRTPKVVKSRRILASLKLVKGGQKILSMNTMNYMTRNLQVVKLDRKECDSLDSCSVLTQKREWMKPQVLVGADYFFEFLQSVKTLKSGFRLVQTSIGPIVAGRGYFEQENNCEEVTNQYLAVDVEEFWNLESLGIRDSAVENEDETAMKLFQKSLTGNQDGRYRVGWLWRDKKPKLSNTFGLCLGRLKNNLGKLKSCPEILKKYDEIIQEQLKLGITEKVPNVRESNSTQYLPHHPVITPKKNTTKVRIVFDASAKVKGGLSLNESMYRGPILLPDLAGILLRWRLNKFVLLGDVEKAFLQIELHKKDREVTRFLWVKDVNLPPDGDNLLFLRFARVLFGVKPSPCLLAGVLKHHLENSTSPLAPSLLKNIYVDNVMISGDNISEAKSWYAEIKRIFCDAKMNIREFISNSDVIQKDIPVEDKQVAESVSVLGINWDVRKDFVVMKLQNWFAKCVTKRTVLQFIASHYDPLGFLVPILLPWKIFCQELWKANLKWDEELNSQLLQKWYKLKESWEGSEVKIPRYLGPEGERELHLFVDASKNAYAVCVYSVIRLKSHVISNLIFAKSRLSPAKGLSIPRLELLAIVIGARALKFVRKQLNWEMVPAYAWSDSVCAILWVRTRKLEGFPRFVKNRIQEVQESAYEFRYVPSESNPADIASRGMLPCEFQTNNSWWHGPEWLVKSQSEWPNRFIPDESAEVKISWCQESNQSEEVLVSTVQNTENPFLNFVNVEYYDSWTRVCGIVKRILLFLKRVEKRKISFLSKLRDKDDVVGAAKLAEIFLIKRAQLEISEDEVLKWNLRKDEEGIFKVFCRLGNVSLPDRFPIFLPRNCYITKLLVLKVHQDCLHSGVSHTLTCVRERFWIEKGRSTVRKILHDNCLR